MGDRKKHNLKRHRVSDRYAERTARHYSGDHSTTFWRLVNAIEDESRRDVLYSAGVLLQEMESRILGWLDEERRVERMYAEIRGRRKASR